MRSADLLHRLHEEPFQPFRIDLADRTKLEVRQPGMAIVGLDRAVLATKFTVDRKGRQLAEDWQTILFSDIVKLSRLPGRRG